MFVTNPSFQFEAPPVLAVPGGRYYRAVELTGRFPWFLVTLHVTEDELSFLHTVACYWETDLAELLRGLRPGLLASLQYMDADPAKIENWRLRQIKRVWEAEDPDTAATSLIFEDFGTELFMGPYGDPVETPATRCRVLAQVRSSDDAPDEQAAPG